MEMVVIKGMLAGKKRKLIKMKKINTDRWRNRS